MKKDHKKSIDDIFKEGTPIDNALSQGVQEAFLRHKLLGNPIVVCKNGEIVWLGPEEIQIGIDDNIVKCEVDPKDSMFQRVSRRNK